MEGKRGYVWNTIRTVITFFALSVLYLNFFLNSWKHFLWFSHIALMMVVLAVWTEKRLLVSMAGISVLVFHSIWTIVFLFQILTGIRLGVMTYMFNSEVSILLRSISLFHVVLPVLIIYILDREGYDDRGFIYQTFLSILVLVLSYLISPYQNNINWVYGPGRPQELLPAELYFLILLFLIPFLVYYPTHRYLKRRFGN